MHDPQTHTSGKITFSLGDERLRPDFNYAICIQVLSNPRGSFSCQPFYVPLRKIRTMADEALKNMSARFNQMYAKTGRPSIAPEKLLRAQLIQMLYSVRSERLLMEEIDYKLRCTDGSCGMNLDDPVWGMSRCSRRIGSGCWKAT